MTVLNSTHLTTISAGGENVLVDQPGSPEAQGTYWLGNNNPGGDFILFGGTM